MSRGSDHISKLELKFYLDHWGLQMSPSQLDLIFQMLDSDADGKISFQDWT
jgi:Ca2+-binding EF-hand superfamily protein